MTAKILIGALLIGMLRPTNTWDYPVFLTLGCIGLLYVLLTKNQVPKRFFPGLKNNLRKAIFALFLAALLAVLSIVLFTPFDRWYGQAYSSVELWKGDKTPIWAYFVHWGFFLFILISWVVFTVWHWMKTTPLASMEPYYHGRKSIILAMFVFLLLIVGLVIYGAKISLVALPLMAVFLVVLVFDRNASDTKRFVLLLLLAGLGLTVMVELIALKGDIGRMNTVFKFYLQAWTFFAVGSVYLLNDLFNKFRNERRSHDHSTWKFLLGLISVSVLLFPLMSSIDKINDRISDLTPLTLDGMDYMKYSTYLENDQWMDLNQDYYAIRWMQDHVEGTPVIAEGNVPEYQWGNRFSIYTGLPSVVGWNWHQRQQRAINPGDWVFERVEEVTDFYSNTDIQLALDFINKYDVKYIVVGQLEEAVYSQEGLQKFEDFSGKLWDIVYESADTRIYRVRG